MLGNRTCCTLDRLRVRSPRNAAEMLAVRKHLEVAPAPRSCIHSERMCHTCCLVHTLMVAHIDTAARAHSRQPDCTDQAARFFVVPVPALSAAAGATGVAGEAVSLRPAVVLVDLAAAAWHTVRLAAADAVQV